MQSIIIPVFSLTWPFRNHSNIKTFLIIIINAENFLNISFNIFVESVIPPPPQKNEQHLFEIKIKVFTVTFDLLI